MTGSDATARLRATTSAYVYGNVLVLAAVLAETDHAIDDGSAVLVVLATTVTTYLAHVLSEDIAGRIGRSEVDHAHHVRAELRDALPIAVSGAPAALILGLGGLGVLGVVLAQDLAALVGVARLAATGWRVARLSGQRAPGRALWEGVTLAVAGALIALAKTVLGH